MNAVTPLKDYRLAPDEVPETVNEILGETERKAKIKQLKQLLDERDAVLVAHYYTTADLQTLADETGGHVSDSLDMARFGHESDKDTLVVCGVRFMGETAKILNPEKRVLMPDLQAHCSLDLGCPPDEFGAFCDQHPEHTVVVYANTGAAVKARADWMVTSGSAVEVVKHLAGKGEKIIWAPDKYLGEYVQEQSGAEMLIWQGSCIVHEEFKARELRQLKEQHPAAKVLVHPESPAAVVAEADVVGSTTALIEAAAGLNAEMFIVATDNGIFHKMRLAAPDKTFIEAPTAGKSATCKSCAHCPWMAMNGLGKLLRTLGDDAQVARHEIHVDQAILERAKLPITRLLEFTKRRRQNIYGAGDA